MPLLSFTSGSLVLIYACLLGIGVARAFQSPATASLMAQVIPQEHYSNAVTWESGVWQASGILGPALGGLVIALQGRAALAYALVAGGLLLAVLLALLIRPRPVARSEEELTLGSLFAGARFIWNTKLILAAITLDMFAVLLGGATALLPIFARDILQVGATGLGWLRAAPAAGAVLAALTLAHLPPFKHAGRTLLLVVAGFGLATIVFGLSRSFALSLLMLGAARRARQYQRGDPQHAAADAHAGCRCAGESTRFTSCSSASQTSWARSNWASRRRCWARLAQWRPAAWAPWWWWRWWR